MRGNRGLVVFALILIVLAVAAGAVYLYLQRSNEPPSEVTELPLDYVPIETVDIVVAIQNVPRGMRISVEDNAIALQAWPTDNLPYEYYTSMAEVDGRYARMEIPRGMPVLPDMVGRPGGMLAVTGSTAALFEPEDRVAYALPFDTQGAVGWALEPGDRVDVLAALKIMPIYTDFLESGVKEFTYLLSGEEGEVAQSSPFGDFELLPNGRWAAIHPSGVQPNVEPMLLTQMTVQDAIVWHVGIWEDVASTAAATSSGQAGGGVALGDIPGAEPAPTPMPVEETKEVQLVTLLVTREDALVLKYLYEMGADLDLALRPANVTGPMLQTQPVWFRYIVDRYQLPETLPDDPIGPVPLRVPLEVLPEPEPVAEQ